jgi:hypothetical protein
MNLVCAHLREAPRSFPDADNAVSANGWHGHSFHDWPWRGEAMRFYWRYIPDYVRYMKTRECDDERLVAEAWITLIFRAFLWNRAHIPMDCGPVLPSQYHGSRLPVYIS